MSLMDAAIGSAITSVTVPQTGVKYIDKPTVLAVQTSLKAKGFDPGPLDGVFGSKTSAAIKKFAAAVNLSSDGSITYEVCTALRVDPPKAPVRTEVTVSAAKADVAAVANNAAAEAAKADTPKAVQEAAKMVETAAVAQPPAPPDIKAEVDKAVAKAMAAKTEAEVKVAADALKEASTKVAQNAVPGWWVQPAWIGAPLKRWHIITGASVAVVLSTVLIATLRRKK